MIRVKFDELMGTLDLWLCMWAPEEQERFETALVLAMTDAHAPHTRALAYAASNVIGTPRLLSAALSLGERGVFSPEERAAIDADALPLYKLLYAAKLLRGNLAVVERLVRREVDRRRTRALAAAISPRDAARAEFEDRLLDWVDLRDLVAVARTTVEARVFSEVERRVAARGKYQRGRAANQLGFHVRRPSPESGGFGTSPLPSD